MRRSWVSLVVILHLAPRSVVLLSLHANKHVFFLSSCLKRTKLLRIFGDCNFLHIDFSKIYVDCFDVRGEKMCVRLRAHTVASMQGIHVIFSHAHPHITLVRSCHELAHFAC